MMSTKFLPGYPEITRNNVNLFYLKYMLYWLRGTCTVKVKSWVLGTGGNFALYGALSFLS